MRIKLLLFILIIPIILFANTGIEITKGEQFVNLLISYSFGALLYFLKDSSRYFFEKNFKLKVFYSTNIKPFLWSFGGGILILFILIFIPQIKPFAEATIGSPLDYNPERLIIAGGIIGSLIKNYIKKVKNEKVEA